MVFSVMVREDGGRGAVGGRVTGRRGDVVELLVRVRDLVPRGGR